MANAKKMVKVKLNRALVLGGKKHRVGDIVEIPASEVKKYGKDVEVVQDADDGKASDDGSNATQ